MKKILSWCGSHAELLFVFFLTERCLSCVVKDGWSVAILFLPFIAMWIFVYLLHKEISRLTKKNEELKETNKQLEKAYEEKTLAFIRTDDLKMLYMYKYLLAQNNVDLCKRKINCTKYLERREYYERMIEFFVKDIKAKEIQ